MHAPCCGIAGIRRAGIAVVAANQGMMDSRGRIAAVGGAGVSIVDIDQGMADACDRVAVIGGADIAVIHRDGRMLATARGIARIRGAGIAVVAIQRGGTGADPGLAGIGAIANIAVVLAGAAIRFEGAGGTAAVAVLDIPVIALFSGIQVSVPAFGSSRAGRGLALPAIFLAGFVPVADQVAADASQAVFRAGIRSLRAIADGISAVAIAWTGLSVFLAGITNQVSAESAVFRARGRVFSRLAELISAKIVWNRRSRNIDDEISRAAIRVIDDDDHFSPYRDEQGFFGSVRVVWIIAGT
jgi:hypothetical protein